MRRYQLNSLAALAVILGMVGCDEPAEVVVAETRPVTTKDSPPFLDATSDQRFRNAKPAPVTGDAPDHWLELPASQFRDLNFRFGESGFGEVYVTIAAGSELDNVNRWLEQFGAKNVLPAELAAMRRVPMADALGVWVVAEGSYVSGMGSPARDGYGLAGVILEHRGRTLTLKMVGPANEVREQHGALEAFAATLKFRE